MIFAIFGKPSPAFPPSPSAAAPPMQNTPPILLHRAFAEQAKRTPSRPAVQEEGRVVTFGELARQAARVRNLLLALDLEPGARVVLHAPRSIDGVAGMLGILEAGAAVIPVAPSDPVERMEALFRFADIGAVVDTPRAPLSARWAGPTVRSDGDEGGGEVEEHGGRAGVPERRVEPSPSPATGQDPPAFILRSSGSTDTPKLIVRSHGSFRHRLLWTWRHHPFQDDDVGCQKAHVATTHAIYELFEPLLQGAPVVLMAEDEVRQLERFWEVVRTRGITRLLLVPSALRASLDLPGFDPPPLRVLVLMGEYVSPDLVERAIQAFPATTALYSIYGSTEASSTLVCDLRSAFRPGSELPLGTPVSPDVRVEVLDPSGRPVSEGASGRLHLGGGALFRGYLGDAERTAAVLADRGDGRGLLYDTRDDVRVEREGRLVFLGRTDDTVKVRGFRVDLKEVERALLRHPDVTQAVVVARGRDAASSRLDAWVAPGTVDPSAVFDTLRRHLPDYMIPASLTPVMTFPLTPSGKVDRRRLAGASLDAGTREPGLAGQEGEGAGRGGENLGTTAEKVAAAWREVLGHPAFGPDQSFFEVGGTSLTVFRVVQAIRRAFDLEEDRVDEELLYRFPTVRALAAALEAKMHGRPGEDEEPGGTSTGRSPLLVTLRDSGDPTLAPFFLLASSGGTVGVYERLAREFRTRREILGVRDPYLWGDRDPRMSTAAWAGRYVEAMRSRQPRGPYHVGAYSSGGAFGIEVARQLRALGEEVALLVLVDPLGLDRPDDRSFGFWASRATWGHPLRRELVRLWGRLRVPAVRWAARRGGGGSPGEVTSGDPNGAPLTADDVASLGHEALSSPEKVLAFSALLEMNTGRPLALEPDDLARDPAGAQDTPFQRLLDRVAAVAPDLDPGGLERVATQYPLQVRAQQQYRIRPLDVPTLMVEPRTRYRGLLPLVLRPHLRPLQVRVIPLGMPTDRVAHLATRFGAWAPHFRCMRDDAFVEGLARAIEARLDALAER
jgi:acyl-coenzyme A synthetase/AMP-(fatty) acid ligase